MGSEVIATCQCGVNTSIMVGGGMYNHMTTCYFPCLCERCRAVVQGNLLDKPNQCPQCKFTEAIPYDDPTLPERTETPTVDRRDRVLRWCQGKEYRKGHDGKVGYGESTRKNA